MQKVHDIISGLANKPVTLLVAMLLAAIPVFALACGAGSGCATVTKEVRTITGCSADDDAAIAAATAKIVHDATIGVGDATQRASAAIDIIMQLGALHTAWGHCKANSTTEPSAPATVVPMPKTSWNSNGDALLFPHEREAFDLSTDDERRVHASGIGGSLVQRDGYVWLVYDRPSDGQRLVGELNRDYDSFDLIL
jgi:hypothetical protein